MSIARGEDLGGRDGNSSLGVGSLLAEWNYRGVSEIDEFIASLAFFGLMLSARNECVAVHGVMTGENLIFARGKAANG
jgi:hypothetical protein